MDVPKDMQNYFLIVLYRGERYLVQGTPEQVELQGRHLWFNRNRCEEGSYKAVGPTTDGGEILAFAVVDAPNLEAAQALADQDPGVVAGHLRSVAHPLFWPSLDAVRVTYPETPPIPGMQVPNEMRNYFAGVMFRGPLHLERDSPGYGELQERHLAFNRRRAEEGRWKAFGPVTDGGALASLRVFEAQSLEEAQALIDEDPAVQAGHLRGEAHPLFWPSLDAVKVGY